MGFLPPNPRHQDPSSDAPASAPGETLADDPVAAILRVLQEGERFLVCSHSRPDGDAVGSMLAFGMLLAQMGKHADLVTADRIPAIYRHLPGADAIHTVLRVDGHYDAAILLECDGPERTRLHGLEPYFLVNIDHHITGQAYAHLNWIEHRAASTGELVHRLAKAVGARITPEMATCLYVTVLTDTGSFSYGSLGASTFALARELALCGADPIAIAREIYFSVPAAKVMLLGAALNNLHIHDSLAWLWVTQQDMARTCAAEEDCEGIVNFAVGISGIEAAVFLRELPEGHYRLSLRGKDSINVAAIAEKLGGGGHENAAGCTLDGPLDRAVRQILAELRAAAATSGRTAEVRARHEEGW